MSNPATFAAVAGTVYAAHVLTYSVTLSTFLFAASWWLGLRLAFPWLIAGLALSGVTHQAGDYWVQTSGQAADKGLPGWKGHDACLAHYFSDRRRPLAWLAGMLGKRGFYEAGTGLATGAALLDQAWHWTWLFASALLISGPPR